jgi:hypothetical protein
MAHFEVVREHVDGGRRKLFGDEDNGLSRCCFLR